MKTKVSLVLGLAALLSMNTVALAAPSAASGSPVPLSNDTQVQVPTQVDPVVDKKVHDVSKFYAGLKSFSGVIDSTMHVEAQSENYKNDVQSLYEVRAQKPNEISFVMKSGKLGGIAKSDGKQLSLYSPQLGQSGLYMKTDSPPDMTQMFSKPEFAFVSGGMSGLSLLEALLAPDPYSLIMNGVTAANVVGKEKIDGVETTHLHFAQKELTWDLWVDSGKEPWVRKVVPDVSTILAHYQGAGKDMSMTLSVTYKDLKSNPEIPASDFVFKAPDNSKEVNAFFGTPETATANARSLMRKPAPAIKLDTVNGGSFDLASHKGKDIVVLEFGATWCPPCQKTLPMLNEITQEYAAKGVKVFPNRCEGRR